MGKWNIDSYHLPLANDTTLDLPQGSKILSVINQYDKLYVFVDVNTESSIKDSYRFVTYNARYVYSHDESFTHLGTVSIDEGHLIVNVFYKKLNSKNKA